MFRLLFKFRFRFLRSGGFLSLRGCLEGDGWGATPRPSDISGALNILMAGSEKNSDYCSAWYQFPLGKLLLSTAGDIVECHASDILGDIAFDAAFNMLQLATVGTMRVRVNMQETISFKAASRKIIGKVLSAVSIRSPSRSEE